MKVVIDTNMMVSSFWGGNAGEIINLWRLQQITLCLSKAIIDEYVAVLQRMKLSEEKLAKLLNLFRHQFNIVFIAKTKPLEIVKADPDDNKFIECAVELDAKFIISGDKHLYEIENYMGIEIVKPKQFLEVFKQA